MSNRQPPKVFLDTNILIAAVFSARGGSREILRLGEIGVIQLFASQDMLAELEENVLKIGVTQLPGHPLGAQATA